MARFAIELVNANTFRGDEVEGYLYEQERIDETTGEELNPVLTVRPVASIKDTSYIPFWDSAASARYAVKRLPDAFFDRYAANVVELEG